jgi:hypothetical protein
MNIYLIIILTALIGEFVLQCIVRYLNLKALDIKLPDEFKGFYHVEEYSKSQEYTRAQTKFEYVVKSILEFLHAEFHDNMRYERFIRCILRCFESLSGVPWVLVFDNTRTVVEGRNDRSGRGVLDIQRWLKDFCYKNPTRFLLRCVNPIRKRMSMKSAFVMN